MCNKSQLKSLCIIATQLVLTAFNNGPIIGILPTYFISKLFLSELHDFYTELYSNRDSSNHNTASAAFLDHCRLPTLNEDVKQICEGVLTKAECFKALRTFKNGKSPGNDALTAEFYQAFWPTLGHLLVDSLNSSFEKGELANSQKQVIIKLISY